MFSFIKTSKPVFQIAFGMADYFHIAIVVSGENVRAERAIHSGTVGEIVCFEHVDQKVNCGTRAFVVCEQRVQRSFVSFVNGSQIVTAPLFGIINQQNKLTGLSSEKMTGRKTNFLFIARRNHLAGADHSKKPGWRRHRIALTNATNHFEGATDSFRKAAK